MTINFRSFLAGAALVTLAACAVPTDPDAPPVAMGEFHFGLNVVVVDEPTIGPFSRTETDEVLQAALSDAMERRFGAYSGGKLFHIGVKLDAYVLALPGVPLVFTPKSVLVITVNMWDDATGEKVNEEAKALTIFEGFSGETLIGSGLTQNKKQQLTNLANNAAKAIQDWILENPEWVGLPPLSEQAAAAAAAKAETTVQEQIAN